MGNSAAETFPEDRGNAGSDPGNRQYHTYLNIIFVKKLSIKRPSIAFMPSQMHSWK
ncbi:MAG: hypothetical protein OSA42_03495 [Porticoccaceae bacterium]|nr:hypothetical protein [Porticoccaceae bacterium]